MRAGSGEVGGAASLGEPPGAVLRPMLGVAAAEIDLCGI